MCIDHLRPDLFTDPDLQLVHVRRPERHRHVVLPLHAQDVHCPLPPGKVRQSYSGMQTHGQANAISWGKINPQISYLPR